MSGPTRAATEGGRNDSVGAARRGGPKRAGGVVVLFALEREAAPFRRAVRGRAGVAVSVTGVGARAAALAWSVIDSSAPKVVVMAGFCGALRDGLAVGDVIEAAEVVEAGGKAWACAGGPPGVRLLTADRIAATPAEKRRLHARHRADVVDMESAAVAAVCAEGGVPFRAVRAVSDTVDTALSPRLAGLLAGGNVSPLRAVAALARQPTLLGEFRRLARDTKLAARNLAEALVEKITAERA